MGITRWLFFVLEVPCFEPRRQGEGCLEDVVQLIATQNFHLTVLSEQRIDRLPFAIERRVKRTPFDIETGSGTNTHGRKNGCVKVLDTDWVVNRE